jgi:hypothetical protein
MNATTEATMDEVIAASFMDFHVKGFSYLCLKRSEEHTVKIYMFDGDVSKLPEVVAPHDHRYAFDTHVLAGAVENRWYLRNMPPRPGDRVFQRFDYLTPLNGGDGFTWREEERIQLFRGEVYETGQRYFMVPAAIHTIALRAPNTLLKLDQWHDQVAVGVPTSTWTLNREPPSLSGLYRKPTPDEVLTMIRRAGLQDSVRLI